MSFDSSFSWNSNLSSVPMGIGGLFLFDLMKMPPLLMSFEYCSMNSSTVALLKRTLREIGARLSLRVSVIVALPRKEEPETCPPRETPRCGWGMLLPTELRSPSFDR